MKKLLMLALMAMVLILGACSKDDKEAATTPGKELDNTEQTVDVKEKDNELIVEVDGEEKTIPAKIEKVSADFAKEVKVPKDAEVSISNETGGIGVVDENIRLYVRKTDGKYPAEILARSFTSMMELSEKEKKVQVTELKLSDYPSLKGYDVMLLADGTDIKTYYLVKTEGKDIYETTLEIPTSEAKSEEKLNTLIKVLSTIK